ncbi:MAG: hypothetical protein ACRDZX_07660 [Acidimicrobiales bacterium]
MEVTEWAGPEQVTEWAGPGQGSQDRAVRKRGLPDRAARCALCVRDREGEPGVHNIFSSSIVLSATRCLLSYIVFPVLAPWLGALPVVGPAVGVPVGIAALVFDVRAIRRFFQADHGWRWVAAALYLALMALVAYLVTRDISKLVQ